MGNKDKHKFGKLYILIILCVLGTSTMITGVFVSNYVNKNLIFITLIGFMFVTLGLVLFFAIPDSKAEEINDTISSLELRNKALEARIKELEEEIKILTEKK